MKINKVYLGGPISGIKDDNKPAFEDAERRLIKRRYIVVNPHKLDHSDNPEGSWFGYMRVCIAAMLQCDAIVLLDGWENSEGAKLEIKLATSLNMPWAFMCKELEFHTPCVVEAVYDRHVPLTESKIAGKLIRLLFSMLKKRIMKTIRRICRP